jgi:hypothetical protein
MKYDSLVNKLLEDFNIFPQSQVAGNMGPDQGITQGDNNNTFPSSVSTVKIPLPKKKKNKKNLKLRKKSV